MPSGKAWSESDDDSLKRLLEHGVDYKACAHTLNRSILAIRIRAHHLRRNFTQRGPVPSDSGASSETHPPARTLNTDTPGVGAAAIKDVIVASFDSKEVRKAIL